MPARFENLDGEIERHLNQMHGSQMIGLSVSGGRRSHVRQHHVRPLPAQRGHQLVRRIVVQKVLFQNDRTGNLNHVQIVDAHDQNVLRR